MLLNDSGRAIAAGGGPLRRELVEQAIDLALNGVLFFGGGQRAAVTLRREWMADPWARL